MSVVVVGAGVVGLAIAWRLVEEGAEVTVLDPAPAQGATHAAAGMLAPVSEYWHREEELLALSLRAAELYPALLDRLGAATGIELHHRDEGTLVVAATAGDRELLAGLRQAQRAHRLEVGALTTREARRLEPALSPAIAGAFLSTADRALDPRSLAQAYLRALREGAGGAPVRFVPARVTEVQWRDGAAVGVVDEHGISHRAATVVLAAGLGAAELAQLPAGWHPRLRAVYGETVRLLAPSSTIGPHRTVRALVEQRSVYVVPRGDGRYVIGASEREDGQEQVQAGTLTRLLRDAQQIVPDIAEMTVTETIARARPGTPDNGPLLGELAPGLIAATGTYRHGVLLSPAVAEAVAAVVGGAPLPAVAAPFEPWRFSATQPAGSPARLQEGIPAC